MIRLLRIYELVFLYFIGFAYFISGWFRLDGFDDNNIQNLFFEAALVGLLLYSVREFVVYIRFRKLKTKTVCDYNVYIYIFRILMTIGFYFLLGISSFHVIKFLIILTGPVLNYILPKPVSEGVHVNDSGFIIKAKFYKFSDIDKIVLSSSGDVGINCCGREENVTYHTKSKNLKYMIIYYCRRLRLSNDGVSYFI